jgi:hypothetical protein
MTDPRFKIDPWGFLDDVPEDEDGNPIDTTDRPDLPDFWNEFDGCYPDGPDDY